MTFNGILKKTPRYLYKYRMINERIDSLFLNNELYFSAPSGFNDPFDSKVLFLLDGTEENKQQYAERVLKDSYPKLPPEKIEEVLQKIKGTPLTKEDIYSLIEKLGIFSLSEDKESLLMWSHYADSHRGICLGFDVRANDFFKRAMSVVYETEYPLINLYKASDNDRIKVLLTKSNDWSYEKEWRIIELKGKGVYTYPSICLKEVILGCKISDENKNKIIALKVRCKIISSKNER
jgi:hypothetical protein